MSEERKQCQNCKGWFEIKEGLWINGWYYTPCPHCDVLLKTQTSWFELRAALHEHQLNTSKKY